MLKLTSRDQIWRCAHVCTVLYIAQLISPVKTSDSAAMCAHVFTCWDVVAKEQRSGMMHGRLRCFCLRRHLHMCVLYTLHRVKSLHRSIHMTWCISARMQPMVPKP